MSEPKHTPGPWNVGAQNGMLFVVAGRLPSVNDDYPVHDANRTAIARIYDQTDNKLIPIESGDANARLIAAAPEMYRHLRWLLDSDSIETITVRDQIVALLARIDGEPEGGGQ